MKNNKIGFESSLTVVYDNTLNSEIVSNLTPAEHNLWMGIMAKIKNKGTHKTKVSFEELEGLSGVSDTHNKAQMVQTLESLSDKITRVNYRLHAKNNGGSRITGHIALFHSFLIDKDTQNLEVSINPELDYLTNRFTKGTYTSFKHEEFIGTKNKYGKMLFRILAQFKSTGFVVIKKDELMQRMNCPKSYSLTLFHDRCLKPAIESCQLSFNNLRYEQIKYGKKVVRYEFYFDKNSVADSFVPPKEEPSMLEKVKKATGRTRKDVTPAKSLSLEERRRQYNATKVKTPWPNFRVGFTKAGSPCRLGHEDELIYNLTAQERLDRGGNGEFDRTKEFRFNEQPIVNEFTKKWLHLYEKYIDPDRLEEYF